MSDTPKTRYPIARYSKYGGLHIDDKLFHMADILKNESVRGKILVLSTEIESSLLHVLKYFLKPSQEKKPEEDELFGINRPLSNFDCKIKLGYRLGILSADQKHALNALRDLRNKCAHLNTEINLNGDLKNHFDKFSVFSLKILEIEGENKKRIQSQGTDESLLIFLCINHIAKIEGYDGEMRIAREMERLEMQK